MELCPPAAPGLIDVVAAVERAVGGAPPVVPALGLPDARCVILVLIDGLGLEQVLECDAPFLAGHLAGEASTTFPSTTVTALASLSTGLPPRVHGLVGMDLFLRQIGGVANLISWSTPTGGNVARAVKPEGFLAGSFVTDRLADVGVETRIVNRNTFVSSPLSRCLYRDHPQVPYKSLAAFGEVLLRLSAVVPRPAYVHGYYDGVDQVAHGSGRFSDEHRAEVRMVDRVLADLAVRLPPDAVLVVTADHGHVDVQPEGRLVLPESVLALVQAVTGDARARYFHCMPGAAEHVRALLAESYGEGVYVCYSSEALDGGWLGAAGTGPDHPDLAARLGDLVVLPGPGLGIESPYQPPSALIGRHGGLAAGEMRIPVVVATAA